jgi:beta-N-acetylhexosaminidase
MGKGDPAQTFATASTLAEQLAQVGCNVNLAPVVCVNVNPDCPVIGKLGRSFSANPQDVVKHAFAFIDAHHKHQIITALKHFPGHGSSKTDTHKEFTDVTTTYQPYELIPYQQLIATGMVDMIMTAHIMNRTIDPTYPATLSPNFIIKILREQFKFDGVVISDCLSMGAIRNYFSFEDTLIKAINAGCDILIISGNIGSVVNWNEQQQFDNIPTQVCEIIFNAVKQGKIKKECIEQAYTKIQTLKRKFGLIH